MADFGVIFDLDGVIFDSEPIWREAFYVANEKFGVKLTDEFRLSCCGKDENLVRAELRAMPDFYADVDEYRDFTKNYVDAEIERCGVPLKPGFRDIVTYLKENGVWLGLASSNAKARVLEMFRKASVDCEKIFGCMTFGDEVEVAKPDPEIFIKTARGLGLEPGDCYVLEDSPNGIEAAVRGGFRPVMVLDMIAPSERERERCQFIAKNLDEALGFLKMTEKIL
ncbi:MAG: HAD family phosphatase [Clostridia bacterium]|nr:HAD family phosphatase [Clostridia bacterium]